MTSRLLEPIVLGGIELANRISISPMCQYSAKDGLPTAWHQQHVGSLTLGGAGHMVLEASGVTADGRITPGDLGIWSDAHGEALAGLLHDVRTYAPKARFGVQLAHAGRKASSARPWEGGRPLGEAEGGWVTRAPSALPFNPDGPLPHELTQHEIHAVREAFVDAAKRAERAGFDAIELHAAHGYLLHSFCSPISNHRGDAYGGSLANRLRLLLEVAASVRAVWPKDRIMGARITGSDWVEGGLTPEDAATCALQLAEIGLDYVTISSGGVAPGIQIKAEPGYQVPFASTVKKAVGSSIAVQAVGMIITPRQAEEIVADGHADLVAIARAFLNDPRWGLRAAEQLAGEAAWPVQYERSSAKLWAGAKVNERDD